MSHKFFDLTFTPSVKKEQEHYGTRQNYARFESGEPDFFGLTVDETEYISQRDSFYLATVGENGQPYVQFRGGLPGFLKVLDSETLAYADFGGNLQYISVGNLSVNDRAALILMDYPNRQRLKILARIEIKDAEDVPDMIDQLKMINYKAKIERAAVIHVEAFDWNCPRHITPRFTAEEIRIQNQPLYEQIGKLEAEIERLKSRKI
ncbi:MAG: pyridoxamine 5'-phosphate oxidase family protein [Acidobacteriota bacterium]